MRTKRDFYIYALVCDQYVFVGKTYGKEIKPILYRHLRGENKYTKAHFSRGVAKDLQIYALLQVHVDFSIAYRYTLAYIRRFLDAGYTVLNSQGMVEAAVDAHEVTKQILDELRRIPLQQLLNGNPAEKIYSNSEKQEKQNSKKNNDKGGKASEKMTIRMTPSEMRQFDTYIRDVGVTRRQGIMLLLAEYQRSGICDPEFTCAEYARIFMKAYEEDNQRLQRENEELRQKLQQLEKKSARELNENEKKMRDGIQAFFRFFDAEQPENPAIKQGVFRESAKDFGESVRYSYPENENFFLFQPEQILLGRGRRAPLFILDASEDNPNTMIRYYPKKDFVGFSFTNESFGLQDSVWLVGCKRARDDAMDVAFALPIDILPKGYLREDMRREKEIDALIAEATARAEWE